MAQQQHDSDASSTSTVQADDILDDFNPITALSAQQEIGPRVAGVLGKQFQRDVRQEWEVEAPAKSSVLLTRVLCHVVIMMFVVALVWQLFDNVGCRC